MAVPSSDADRYRRWQRRRALIGWGSVLVVIALVALGVLLSPDHTQRRSSFLVPYGETMTSADYEAIDEGEGQGDVLGRLGKSGRPENLTEDYVLVLFPPPPEATACTYWEFSDAPQIFARLCFDESDGELVDKQARDVHERIEESESTVA